MANVVSYGVIDSPVGRLLLTSDGKGLTGLYPPAHGRQPAIGAGWQRHDAFFTGVKDQLEAYFAGRLTRFEVSLAAKGTPFQRRVWDALLEVPYGATVTYGEVAARLGCPAAARAVGLANGRNPISIIVPCHRVVGRSGKLTGYAGGLELKRTLLDHEGHLALRGAGPYAMTTGAGVARLEV
ncbi:MAG: methylated-DNA--[protein]-cysteine S-methyltransferase [Myxococcaceae bacterium]|jgi:methylated-DNA-[protein]-cysteine S-methyltransferase|nr:methylated-DNA--[protein]-cysteine S-methyltransferase [Myxococcaceae bacterium]